MYHAEKHVARFGIFFFDIGFHVVGQGAVARFVALHDFAGLFVDDDNVVIFVDYFHCKWLFENFLLMEVFQVFVEKYWRMAC